MRGAWDAHATTAAVDLAGHGETQSPADAHAFTFDAVADALWKVADAMGVQAPLWGGYSMGARLALYFAIRHPSRVGGLVLESVHPGIADREQRAERSAQDLADATLLERHGLAAFLEAWHSRPVFGTRRQRGKAWDEEVARKQRTNQPADLARVLRGLGLGAMPDLRPRLREVKCPTLVLAGTLDVPYLELGREVAGQIPDAEFKAVPNSGHAVHVENPQRYTAVVDRFLGDLVGREPARGM